MTARKRPATVRGRAHVVVVNGDVTIAATACLDGDSFPLGGFDCLIVPDARCVHERANKDGLNWCSVCGAYRGVLPYRRWTKPAILRVTPCPDKRTRDERTPRPPAELVGASQETIHKDMGPARRVTAIRRTDR